MIYDYVDYDRLAVLFVFLLIWVERNIELGYSKCTKVDLYPASASLEANLKQ
jgi:hypothetical protein